MSMLGDNLYIDQRIFGFHNLGGISPKPFPTLLSRTNHGSIFLQTKGYAIGSLVMLAITETECTKSRQTNKHSSLHRQMPASISRTHNQYQNVIGGDGQSQNRSKFSKFLKNWRKLQFIMIWVKFDIPSSSLVTLTPSRPSSRPMGVLWKFW